jgi:hypothetical protein
VVFLARCVAHSILFAGSHHPYSARNDGDMIKQIVEQEVQN